jgi:hypothetical protein
MRTLIARCILQDLQVKRRADERTRTADLLITSELLYLLSYVGLCWAEYIVGVGRFKADDRGFHGEQPATIVLMETWGLRRVGSWRRWSARCVTEQGGGNGRAGAFWELEIPQDLVEGYGYPQLTEQAKHKILGENLLRLPGMDVEETRRKLAGAA